MRLSLDTTEPTMHHDVLVYLSGPITPKLGRTAEQNAANGLDAHLRLLNLGIPNFCPQLCAAFPSAWTSVHYATWMQFSFMMIDRCTHMLLLPAWPSSRGARAEIEYARKSGVPIYDSTESLVVALNSPSWPCALTPDDIAGLAADYERQG